MKTQFTAIVVVDKNWGIGFQGDLLAHLPGDLAYFKEKTLGKVVLMGRETLESLPGGKPLSGRTTVVLTRNAEYEATCEVINSLEEFLDKCEVGGMEFEEVFIAGGAQIYEQFLPHCDKCLITKIDSEFEADKHFPDLDSSDEFKLVSESEVHEENGFTYRFTEYARVYGGATCDV